MIDFLKRKVLEHNANRNPVNNIELLFLIKLDEKINIDKAINEINFSSKYDKNILEMYLKVKRGELPLIDNDYQKTLSNSKIETQASPLLSISFLRKIFNYAKDREIYPESNEMLRNVSDYAVKLLSLKPETNPETERQKVKNITNILHSVDELSHLSRCDIRDALKVEVKQEVRPVSIYRI